MRFRMLATLTCATTLITPLAAQAISTLPTTQPEYKVVHKFGDATDPLFNPVGGLFDDGNGSLYGTAANSDGTLTTYRIGIPYFDPSTFQPFPGTFTYEVLNTSSLVNGVGSSNLAKDSLGDLYGADSTGGAFSDGVVLKLVPAGGMFTAIPIYTFSDPSTHPTDALVFGTDGNVYGICKTGSVHGEGVVYQLATYVSLTAQDATLPSDGNTTCTITLAFPAPKGGLTVQLLPTIGLESASSVTVPEGALSVTFPVHAKPTAVKHAFAITGIYENVSHYTMITVLRAP